MPVSSRRSMRVAIAVRHAPPSSLETIAAPICVSSKRVNLAHISKCCLYSRIGYVRGRQPGGISFVYCRSDNGEFACERIISFDTLIVKTSNSEVRNSEVKKITQKIKFEGSDMCGTGGRPFSVTLGASRGLDSWRKPWSSRGYVNRGSATKVRLRADYY